PRPSSPILALPSFTHPLLGNIQYVPTPKRPPLPEILPSTIFPAPALASLQNATLARPATPAIIEEPRPPIRPPTLADNEDEHSLLDEDEELQPARPVACFPWPVIPQPGAQNRPRFIMKKVHQKPDLLIVFQGDLCE
ncbi:hypothetical protein Ciccas_014235, partial [Cichlidogyrus casuarinus]